jgi:hypothetical protein
MKIRTYLVALSALAFGSACRRRNVVAAVDETAEFH